MKFSKQLNMALCLSAFLVAQANASIFLEYLVNFLNNPSWNTQKPVLVWQLSGMLVPLLAGPCRIAAYSIWNLSQVSNGVTIDSGMLKAMLYINWDIFSINDLMAYLVDYIVYGNLYSYIGLSTTFTEITFFPSDLQCYKWNYYDDPTNANYAVPSKTTAGDYEQNTYFYANGASGAYPTQSFLASCGSSCYAYTC